MTQTLHDESAATTAVIRYAPYGAGCTVSQWTPRHDPQSPDLRPPTDEHVILADYLIHEQDQQAAAEETVPVTLAEVMPAPERPAKYQARHRMVPASGWRWLALGAVAVLASQLLAGLAVLAVVR